MDLALKIVYGLLALGILVFVHELGHFLLAKYFKVRVETFSIGMGPGILKYKRGDTVYQIGPIPFGGFCKMAGEEPSDKLTGANDELYSKPPSQKLGIIFAGPFFNYVFGILMFIIVIAVGMEERIFSNEIFVSNKIEIKKTSPVRKAGLKSSDKILNINGKKVTNWKSIQERLIKPKDKKEKILTVQRNFLIFFKKTFKLKINSVTDPYTGELLIEPYNNITNSNMIFVKEDIYEFLEPPAKKAGLKAGDVIIKIDNEKVSNWNMIVEKIIAAGDEKEKILTVKRKNEIIEFKVRPIIDPNTGRSMIGILLYPTTRIEKIVKGLPAEKSGLKENDEIIRINNKKINNFSDLYKYISERPYKVLTIYVKRTNKILSFNVKTTNLKKRGLIGVDCSIDSEIYIPKSKNIFSIIVEGFNEANQKIKQTIYGLKIMISGKVKVKKAVTGPIGIIYFIGDITKAGGFLMFLYFMGIISVLLGFFNLLPIPAVDGSYILIFLFELIIRRKLNYKVIQIVQYIGLMALMGLLLLVSYNDVLKLIQGPGAPELINPLTI